MDPGTRIQGKVAIADEDVAIDQFRRLTVHQLHRVRVLVPFGSACQHPRSVLFAHDTSILLLPKIRNLRPDISFGHRPTCHGVVEYPTEFTLFADLVE